jgi:hypothetical protein
MLLANDGDLVGMRKGWRCCEDATVDVDEIVDM